MPRADDSIFLDMVGLLRIPPQCDQLSRVGVVPALVRIPSTCGLLNWGSWRSIRASFCARHSACWTKMLSECSLMVVSYPQRRDAIRSRQVIDFASQRSPKPGGFGSVVAPGERLIDLAPIVDHPLDLALCLHPRVGGVKLAP